MRYVKVLWVVLMTVSLWACSSTTLVCEEPMPESVGPEQESPSAAGDKADGVAVTTAEWQQCRDRRVVRCTREYRPVCATRDTGVRCVTTPCPSIEMFTASNACMACAKPDVTGYVLNACNAMQKTDSE